jgi:ASC-1-like (ASCH) protein
MNVNIEMIKSGKAKVDDRLFDSERNYRGKIISINLKEGVVWVKYKVHKFPLDINKIK